MKNKKVFKIIVLALSVLTFASCATTLNVRLTRPAQLDLNGARTISVLPFKPCAYYREYDTSLGAQILINSFYQIFDVSDPNEDALLNILKSDIERGLADSPYINLIHSNEVLNAQKNGRINPADVYLTGEMAYFSVRDNSFKEKELIKEAEGNRKAEYAIITYWDRTVEFRFRYQVVDSSNSQVISYREIHRETTSDSYKNRRELPSAYKIAESDMRAAARTILKELQPYTVTKSITLLETKTKDKFLKERMKNASKLASDSFIQQAIQEFDSIYDETGLLEAGYNSAILEEALGELSEAEKKMQEVYDRYPDNRVEKALSDIRNEIQLANRLQKQIKESAASEDSEDLDADF